MNSPLSTRWWQLLLLWAAVLATALAFRSFTPIDETRYVAVAWEMWLRGDLLVPHLNGQPYAHKPPLLFWLYNLGWWLFGVNEWWPRLVAPLFGLGSIWLTFLLGRDLWPERPAIAPLSAWLLFGSLYWAAYGTTAMFDMLVVFFSLLGLLGIWRASRNEPGGWPLLGVAIGLGILAKGPVVLLHLLPVALLAPLWSGAAGKRPGQWYRKLLGALLLGAGIALAWAIPAALRGGDDYAQAIFWGQTANRMVDSFAHKRPFWWYLPLLPLLLYPWFWWPPVWQGLRRLAAGNEPPLRFLLAWLLPAFLALSLISGKQAHYLLPLFPGMALLAARGLAPQSSGASLRLPGSLLILTGLLLLFLGRWQLLPDWVNRLEGSWGLALILLGLLFWWLKPADRFQAMRWLALSSVALIVVLHLVMRLPLRMAYDLTPISREIARLQQAGIPLVHESKYAGEYHFLGRLQQPLKVLNRKHLEKWARHNPGGYIIYYYDDWESGLLPEDCHFWQHYRGGYVALIPGHLYLDQLSMAD